MEQALFIQPQSPQGMNFNCNHTAMYLDATFTDTKTLWPKLQTQWLVKEMSTFCLPDWQTLAVVTF